LRHKLAHPYISPCAVSTLHFQRQVGDLKPMAVRTREAEAMAERMVAAKVLQSWPGG
jgi:hypothetical protein